MALFDSSNPLSAEVATLWHLVDLLTECTAVQTLTEATGGTEAELKASARERFIIGPHGGPWDADEFSLKELESRFIEIQVHLPEEGGAATVKSDGSFSSPDETGEIHLLIRRLCRASELADFNETEQLDGKQDLYLFFADCTSAMRAEAMTLAESRECPRLLSFVPLEGPVFGLKECQTAQGEYLFGHWVISWGDPIGDQ